jgi:tetratricopeptide (TPR) repeat protein
MASVTRAQAKKANYANELQLCTTFNDQLLQTVTPIQNIPTFSAQEPLSPELLIHRMAGNEQDCKKGAQIIYAAVIENELSTRELKLLLQHPLFRISFDLPDHSTAGQEINGEVINFLDRFIMHINLNRESINETIRHELTHSFLTFISNSQLDPEIFPITLERPDIAMLFKQSGQKTGIDALRKKWENRLYLLMKAYINSSNKLPITAPEKKILDLTKKAIAQDKHHENTLYFRLTKDDCLKFKKGETYPLISLIPTIPYTTKSDTFIVIDLDTSENNEGITIQIDNQLLLFIMNQMKSLFKLEEYPPQTQAEEYIAYISESIHYEALRVIYPELIQMLEYYANQLESTYTPAEYAVPPEKNNYLHTTVYKLKKLSLNSPAHLEKAYADIADILGKQKNATERELDNALAIISQLIKHDDQPKHRVMLGEVLYLRGNMKLAAQAFHKAYKEDKAAFKFVPDALEHHAEAVKLSPGSQPLTGSEKRALKKSHP